MDFFTKIDISVSEWPIDYNSHVAFFGSCFADNVSAQFAARKFKVLTNPFGTVYNPLSIAMQIKAIANGKKFGGPEIFQDMRSDCTESFTEKPSGTGFNAERCGAPWHCWDAHGSLSAATREECITKLDGAADQAREFLQKADVVFITLGTAFVYFLRKSGVAISNCHRQNPNLFIRKMISVDHAAEALKSIVHDLQKIKCDWIASPSSHASLGVSVARNDEQKEKRELHIVFTVSPLRHLSDGAHENTLSKSTLQLAIEKVMREIDTTPAESRNDKSKISSEPSTPCDDRTNNAANSSSPLVIPTVHYFPSYEIVMDELRDYRFYDSDMIHLSKIAENYIFERMAETYCTEETRENIHKVEKFMKSVNHRIVDAQAPAARNFAQKILAQAAELENQIAGLDLNEERQRFANANI